jgi:hypothetical protein
MFNKVFCLVKIRITPLRLPLANWAHIFSGYIRLVHGITAHALPSVCHIRFIFLGQVYLAVPKLYLGLFKFPQKKTNFWKSTFQLALEDLQIITISNVNT